jgi:hypothetical protein
MRKKVLIVVAVVLLLLCGSAAVFAAPFVYSNNVYLKNGMEPTEFIVTLNATAITVPAWDSDATHVQFRMDMAGKTLLPLGNNLIVISRNAIWGLDSVPNSPFVFDVSKPTPITGFHFGAN